MKRKITVMALLLSMFFTAGTRLWFLSTKEYVNAGVTGATKTKVVSSIRGNIYDCNFEKLVNCAEKTFVAAKPCIQSADILKSHLSQRQYLELLNDIGKGELFFGETDGFETNEETVKCVRIIQRYSEDDLACHVTGYINAADNEGVCGIEKSYDSLLKEDNSLLKLRYSANAKDALLIGDKIEFLPENYYSKKGVKLTIDKQIQKTSENAMKLYCNECGACVVMDADRFEIKAMVSTPSFDRENVGKYLQSENSPLLNRALNAYSVGSVFKSVVAAAAIKYGLDDFVYDCKGSVDVGGNSFCCSSCVSHGKTDMSSALANSCNTYFISLALKLGAKRLLESANNLGFGQQYILCDDIVSDAGYLPPENEVNSDGALANLAFGQGSLLATPLQVATCYCAMITDGTLEFPSLVEGVVDTDGSFHENDRKNLSVRALEKNVAEKVRNLLSKNLEHSNYAFAKSSYNCSAGGKTSTAQTGWYGEDGEEILHSWFAGFVSVGQENYVVVVFKENGTGGAVDCAPIFREISDRIIIYRRDS